MWSRMRSSGSQRSSGSTLSKQGSAYSVGSEGGQPELKRSGSSNFHFQYNFSRDNPGRLLDSYDLDKRSLGEGSFGTARTAKCKETGLVRAVKTIAIKAVKDPKRLELEISIAKQLDHPNVVRLFETFHEDDKLHIVMELCTGGELFDRIVNEGAYGFGEGTAAKYVKQMMASICYLHAHNVAHRDVKPENFLFQSRAKDAQLKCIDFGLARVFEPGKAMSTRVGTAYYVAPEVLKGNYDAKCDVWSVGVISYLLLCGYAPFSGDDDSEILRKVRKGSFKFNSPEWDTISKRAKAAICGMLAFNPADRLMAAQVLEIPWLKDAAAQPIGSPKASQIPDVVARLQQFRTHTRMKRVALTAMAQNLPESETQRLGEIFRVMDTDGDGELSAEEVRRGLELQGIQPPQALEEILRAVDCNGSGRLDYTEFVAAMMDEQLCNKRDLCRAAFRAFDLDGDGIITSTELSKVLSASDVNPASPAATLSRARIDNMIKQVDRNGDGSIDFEEFCDMLSPSQKCRKTRTAPAIQAACWGHDADSPSNRMARGTKSERRISNRLMPGLKKADAAEGPADAAPPPTVDTAAADAAAAEAKMGWRERTKTKFNSTISLAKANIRGLTSRR